MRAVKWIGNFFLLLGCLGLFGWMWEYADERALTYDDSQPLTQPAGNIYIVINIHQRLLELYNDGNVYKRYRIAVGKRSSPTPVGEWYVVNKAASDKEILGTHWLGLSIPWGSYGIHGTDKPWSIGQFASKGCIRLCNRDIAELYEWVPVGTMVRIEGEQIRIERLLKYQTAGPDVALLQLKLKKAGYFYGRADGLFGRTTEDAVRLLQQDKKLPVTGEVDKRTLQLLGL